MLKEFRDFIQRGNVLDLAVAVVIGAAFTAIVNSFVNDLLMPLISLVTGGVEFADRFLVFGGGEFATLEAAREAGAVVMAYGAFIDAVINFLIVAFVVFMIVRQYNKMHAKAEEEAAPAGPTEVELLTEIRDALKK